MKVIFLSLLMSILFVGCSSELEDPDAVTREQMIRVTTTKNILQANASDTTLVTAQIPKSAGRLDISFTSTKGSFIQSDAKTIKQLADSISGDYRYATTVLKSDSSKGQVYITAETGSARNRTSLTFN